MSFETVTAPVIVIDSASHLHEGPGGLLEQHAANVHRMAGDDYKKADRVKMTAWIQPKQDFRRFVNSLLQMEVAIIMCFRAKEKIKPIKGGDPEDQGWMPIISDELPYEMTLNALLEPGSDGVPTWDPQEKASRGMVKLPAQFRNHFTGKRAALDETDGEFMARWARGEDLVPVPRFLAGKEWAGKPLADAPVDVLVRYKDASIEGLAKKKGADADKLRAHIDDVTKEIESRVAVESQASEPTVNEDGEVQQELVA